MKFYFGLVAMLIAIASSAQTTGVGCRISNDIYTEPLGIAYPYGPATPISYYKSTGNSVAINYNNYNGSNPPTYYGYQCGKINSFPSSSTGPAQNEFIDTSSPCIISPTLGGSINGNGVLASYSYNKTAYCTSTPLPLPIDDILIPLSLLFTGLCLIILRGQRPRIVGMNCPSLTM